MKRSLVRLVVGCTSIVLLSVFAGCSSQADNASVNKTITVSTPLSNTPTKTFEVQKVREAIISDINGYKLLWNDEFNETVLDESIWNFEAHEPGWVNDELQEYTTSIDNVYLENGNAVIRAIKTTDSDGNDTYTSGNITSKKINDFISGKVVVKAKIPKGQGLWPAISMIANDESKSRDLSNCFTIDILDIQGYQPELAYGGIHYGIHYMEYGGDYELKDRTFADDFHEFSIEWEPDEMRFFIDDNLFYTAYDWKSFMEEAEEDTSAYPAEFNQNFLLQINLAVGGISPGSPDATTDFENAKFQIDYVRVYKKE